jgi:hypothetical protein
MQEMPQGFKTNRITQSLPKVNLHYKPLKLDLLAWLSSLLYEVFGASSTTLSLFSIGDCDNLISVLDSRPPYNS